jgi:hypothetical protein
LRGKKKKQGVNSQVTPSCMIDIAMVFMVVMWEKKEILKNIYEKKSLIEKVFCYSKYMH